VCKEMGEAFGFVEERSKSLQEACEELLEEQVSRARSFLPLFLKPNPTARKGWSADTYSLVDRTACWKHRTTSLVDCLTSLPSSPRSELSIRQESRSSPALPLFLWSNV